MAQDAEVAAAPLTASTDRGIGTVLVADDESANRRLVRAMLEAEGHLVLEAVDGAAVLDVVAETPPDVILLDVMMPVKTGIEACHELKANPVTASIPILLVTALDAREDRLLGMRAGANDFLIKPVDRADLVLRVRNSVRMKHLYDGVASQYEQLRELESSRDALVHMIIHDLRSPMAGLSAYLQLLREEPLGEDGMGYVKESLAIVGRLHRMTGAALDVSRFEEGKMPLTIEEIDLADAINDALELAGPEAQPPRVVVAAPAVPVRVKCDRAVIGRVFANLIDNAIRVSPRETTVRVTYRTAADRVRVEVADEGPGIPEESRIAIFEKFVQAGGASRSRHTSGLGLAFCRLAIEAHGGEIGVTAPAGKGTLFWFHLPITPA
jgi:two-component system sensor histidine kinase/response regulator